MERLAVSLCGIELDNPVIAASGTFGYGYEFADIYDINCLGTFSFKGTTLAARAGNPLPRIADCPDGMLNAVGLQNPGVDAVISRELPQLKRVFHKPVMANVSGFSVKEYAEVCRRLDEQEQVGWLEVNVSCPNVHGGGMSFGTDPCAAAEVTRAVKAVTRKPVILKLSPNVTDIVSVAKACEDAGADGLSLINTLMAMRIDLKERKPVRPGGVPGGFTNGVAGVPGGADPCDWTGRGQQRGGCDRDAAGGRHGGPGGRRQPGAAHGLPGYHRRPAPGYGQVRDRILEGYHRRCPWLRM